MCEGRWALLLFLFIFFFYFLLFSLKIGSERSGGRTGGGGRDGFRSCFRRFRRVHCSWPRVQVMRYPNRTRLSSMASPSSPPSSSSSSLFIRRLLLATNYDSHFHFPFSIWNRIFHIIIEFPFLLFSSLFFFFSSGNNQITTQGPRYKNAFSI